jgi:tetratricopeptide (TPR) repeat protein
MSDLTNIGIAFYNNGQLLFAKEYLEKSLALDNADFHAQRYLSLVNTHLPPQIYIDQLHEELASDFDNAERHAQLAQAYVSWRKFDRAIEHAIIAHELKPNNEEYLLLNCAVTHDMFDFKECLHWSHMFLVKFGIHLSGTYYLASAYADLGNLEMAIDYSLQMNDAFENHAVICNNIGFFYAQAGMYNEGAKWARMSIQLDDEFAYAHNNLGLCLLHLKEPEKGLWLVEHSLVLDPSNAYAYRNRAIINESMGNKHQAELDRERAKALFYDQLYPTL